MITIKLKDGCLNKSMVKAAMDKKKEYGTDPSNPIIFRADKSLSSIFTILNAFEENRSLVLLPPEPIPTESYLKQIPKKFEPGFRCIVFTSGSTGHPKAVVIEKKQLEAAAKNHREFHPNEGGLAWVTSLPFFHVGGLCTIFRSLFLEEAIFFLPNHETTEIYESLVREDIYGISLVPTQLHRLLPLLKREITPTLLIGGAPLPEPLLKQSIQLGLKIKFSYGSTESCSQISCTDFLNDPQRSPFFVGKTSSRTKVEIRQEKLFVNGESIAKSFYVEKQKQPLREPDGFYPTNDWARLEGNDLYILGRHDDIIQSGGEKISPLEVENAALSHGSIIEACCVGAFDPEWGEKISLAFVAHETLSPKDIASFLRERLGPIKAPKNILQVAELPKNQMQKIIRHKVKEFFSVK